MYYVRLLFETFNIDLKHKHMYVLPMYLLNY